MSKITIYKENETPKDTHFFSVSQIKLFKTCKMCWALRYLDKMEQAPNAAAQRGVDIHKLLEDYLRDGKPIDPSSKYGKMAMSGIAHLPMPGTCEVEDKFAFQYEDIFFRGIIDFYYKKNDIWVVADHKTTKNFQYALSAPMLAKDLQAALYAFYIMNKMDCTEAELNWVYYLTAGAPKSRLVSSILSLTDAEYNVNLVLDDCREMLDAKRKGLSAIDFDPPIGGCRGFGPCAASIIGNNPLMRDPKMSSEKKSLKDFLDKRAAETGPEEAPAIAECVEAKDDNIQPVSLPLRGKFAHSALAGELVTVELETANETQGWTLLIDNLPRKGHPHVLELSDVLKPVFKKIAKDYNVSHHSQIPYEGRGVFITLLDKHLTDHPIEDGATVLLSTGSPDGRDALDVLLHHAARSSQGTK